MRLLFALIAVFLIAAQADAQYPAAVDPTDPTAPAVIQYRVTGYTSSGAPFVSSVTTTTTSYIAPATAYSYSAAPAFAPFTAAYGGYGAAAAFSPFAAYSGYGAATAFSPFAAVYGGYGRAGGFAFPARGFHGAAVRVRVR